MRQIIRAELKECHNDFERYIRNGIPEIKVSLNFINDISKEMKGQLAQTLTESQDLTKANEKLEKKCEELTKQIKMQDSGLLYCGQYSRNKNIEIKGDQRRQMTTSWAYWERWEQR